MLHRIWKGLHGRPEIQAEIPFAGLDLIIGKRNFLRERADHQAERENDNQHAQREGGQRCEIRPVVTEADRQLAL